MIEAQRTICPLRFFFIFVGYWAFFIPKLRKNK